MTDCGIKMGCAQCSQDEENLSRTGVVYQRKILLPRVVEEWVLVTPLRLQKWDRDHAVQRGDRLLVHLSSKIGHVLETSRQPPEVPTLRWENSRPRGRDDLSKYVTAQWRIKLEKSKLGNHDQPLRTWMTRVDRAKNLVARRRARTHLPWTDVAQSTCWH